MVEHSEGCVFPGNTGSGSPGEEASTLTTDSSYLLELWEEGSVALLKTPGSWNLLLAV